ncbi:MAG: LuxR C-terminal-related transcriptional regulator [Bifidobacteriaceae bacterium]|jgi:DNA-binding CsgD family transcriptional regulator|nr:LuxR C-terminal-related transcriptional regulator [Bifidobacteriaceae bacterium]
MSGKTSLTQDDQFPLPFFLCVVAGHAAMLILNSFTLWNPVGFVSDGKLPWSAVSALSWSCFLSNVLGFFLFAFARPSWRAALTRTLPAKACALLGAGFVLLLLVRYAGLSFTPLAIVAGVLVGVGSCGLFGGYIQLLSDRGTHFAKLAILTASALVVLLHLAVYRLPGSLHFPFVVMMLAPANIILLLLAVWTAPAPTAPDSAALRHMDISDKDLTPGQHHGDQPRRDIAAHRLSSMFPQLWVPLLCVLVLATVAPAVTNLSENTRPSLGTLTALTLISFLLVVALLGTCWFGLKRHLSITGFYVVMMPVLATSLMVMPFFGHGFLYVLYFLGTVGFLAISMLIIIDSIQAAHQRDIPALMVFGVFAGTLYLSRLIGMFIAQPFLRSFDSPQMRYTATALLLLYGLTVVMIIVLRREHTKTDTDLTDSRTFSARTGSAGAADPIAHPWADAEERGESGPSPSQPGGRSGGWLTGSASESGHRTRVAEPTAVDLLALRCAAAGQFYGLTERGSEVLELLARGRSTRFIAQALHLSENTVRTHTKKLYLTMGIHSRQQLIDRLESIDTPGGASGGVDGSALGNGVGKSTGHRAVDRLDDFHGHDLSGALASPEWGDP